MPSFVDITGQQFGRWTVLELSHRNVRGVFYWRCHCACGAELNVAGNNLRAGKTRSCGCFSVETTRHTKTTHGHFVDRSPSRTYYSWAGMLTRCYNSKQKCYKNYGGRGIKVCEHWHTFENFLADMGERPAEHSIDRIDNDGNYEPSNCRWATSTEQMKNRRKHRV